MLFVQSRKPWLSHVRSTAHIISSTVTTAAASVAVRPPTCCHAPVTRTCDGISGAAQTPPTHMIEVQRSHMSANNNNAILGN